MIARAALLTASAVAAGGVLALLLVGGGPSLATRVPGEYWVVLIVATAVILGRYAAHLFGTRVAPLAGALAASVAVATLLGVRALGSPAAPLVGDSFYLLAALYAAAGVAGATLGTRRMYRGAAPALLHVIGGVAWLALVAVVTSVAIVQVGRLIGS